MSYVPSPFVATMDVDQFIRMVQALRDGGDLLSEAYERAERIHEAFYGRRRYIDFETAAQMYYRRHPSRRPAQTYFTATTDENGSVKKTQAGDNLNGV